MKALLAYILVLIGISASAQHRIVAYVGSFDDVQITYDVHTEVPTTGLPAIVLVHGWSCDRTYWMETIPALVKKYKVVVIDLAGHGGSGTGRRDYTMESFGEDVAAVVNKLKLEKVILVGHSMGAHVIAEAARRMPGRVTGLIMVDAYKKLGPGRSQEQVNAVVSTLRDHFRDSAKVWVKSMFLTTSDPALVERISDDMSSAPPHIALNSVEHALNYTRQMPETLLELKLPVIVINSDNSPTDLASMKKYGVAVVIIKGVGHFPMQEDAPRFNSTLVAAIQKLAP